MKKSKLYANGQQLHIDKSIGKGGEGEVFSLTNFPDFAVKIYNPKIAGEREKKIRAMVSGRLSDMVEAVAFPCHAVVNERGNFIGFLMPFLKGYREIHEIQTPQSRHKYFPAADYRFIVRVALNIAKVFAQVHKTGCTIGDINQRSILVSLDATVKLIDADSFQFKDGLQKYLCVVGVPEYTPPELQGKSLSSVIRTKDHDAFGLAICVFQVLCMDKHPFAGRFSGPGEMPLEKAIKEYRFAYSSSDNGMKPPPNSIKIQDLTLKVSQLFEQAFSADCVGRRPVAVQWVEALDELEKELKRCSKNKLHYYARQAVACPWCTVEQSSGVLFLLTHRLISFM